VLRHEAIAPYVDVVANVAGRDLGSVADEVDDVLDKMPFPLEHNPKLMGEYAERQAVEQRILSITIAAVLGIFLLLQACFASWRLALIGFLALPAAIAGGVLAVLVTGATVSLGSLVGFIAVLGIAARNGLLLIDHYRGLERDGMPLGSELVVRGARERFVPIVASAAALFAALAPVALLGRVAGLELLHPMAIVIFGGLAAATAVTLLVMPALYLAAGGSKDSEPAAARA
jgi:Cu/Ag efflux pump CusA